MKAEINFEILDDGTIKFTTDGIPNEHHEAADEFLDEVEKIMGGARTTKQRRAGHVHAHEKAGHEHIHQHRG